MKGFLKPTLGASLGVGECLPDMGGEEKYYLPQTIRTPYSQRLQTDEQDTINKNLGLLENSAFNRRKWRNII